MKTPEHETVGAASDARRCRIEKTRALRAHPIFRGALGMVLVFSLLAGCRQAEPDQGAASVQPGARSASTPSPSWVDFGDDELVDRVAIDGVHPTEESGSRWIGESAVLRFRRPADATTFVVDFSVPDLAPFNAGDQGLHVQIGDGEPQTFCCYGPGSHRVTVPLTPADVERSEIVRLDPEITFMPASAEGSGEDRILGLILLGAGFR